MSVAELMGFAALDASYVGGGSALQIRFSCQIAREANASHLGLTGCRVTLLPFSPEEGRRSANRRRSHTIIEGVGARTINEGAGGRRARASGTPSGEDV